MYEGYDLSVVLAFDRPLPAWAAATASTWCVQPPIADTATWATLKNNLSQLVGQFVAWLGSSAGGGFSAQWIATKLLVEPWNEFDAVADTACTFPSTAPSAARAADLAGE